MTSATVAAPVLPAAAQPPPPAPAPTLRWSPCHQDLGPFECATLQVPLDYDHPGRNPIRIGLVRLPATSPEDRIGSLLVNPGGPGGSGVELVLLAGQFLYSDEVRARFDLVGFDPRGIITSSPLRCFRSLDQALAVFATPFAFPVTEEEESLWIQTDIGLDAFCDRHAGPIRDHMATGDVARDMDRLRQALGDDQLNYVGYSYGSLLGVTYANMFPDRVRAVVVDGVLDPVAWTTGVGNEAATLPFSYRLRSDAGAQATLDEFFRLCDESPDGCAFAGNSADRFAAVADRLLTEGPVEVIDPFTGELITFTYQDLIDVTLGAMYSSSDWPLLAAFLVDLEAAASPAVLGASLQAVWDSTGFTSFPPPYPNFVEGFVGVVCSDSDNPDDHSFWSAAADDADANFGYFGRIWTWISSPCAVWSGADADRYIGPWNASTDNPVLVVGTRFDPATRYEGAETVRALLPESSLLTVEGWGHTSLFLSACADAAVAEYLLTAVPPADGTVCTQDFGPFDVAALPSIASTEADAAVDAAEARALVMDEIALVPRR
jgi:pimeloyl-ACP methyl ester carboxylesterase